MGDDIHANAETQRENAMGGKALEGLTALVTGASGGIAKASVAALARDGATVLMVSRNEKALEKARSEIRAETPDARLEIFAADACEDASVREAVARAHALAGRLDILVPTVGGPTYIPVRALDPDKMMKTFQFNFMSAFLMVHHGLPFLKSGASIVCVSTAAVGQANMGLSAYGASNAAIERWVKGAAFELGRDGIRINAVRPGATLSREVIEAAKLHHMEAAYAAETPLGRIGDPTDIAKVIRFLAGPESAWITGETISADGGMQQGKAPDLGSVI
jgi:NAD(P)-dependent dehydrogenase (short-subunit alcohol dehydrogenase family)